MIVLLRQLSRTVARSPPPRLSPPRTLLRATMTTNNGMPFAGASLQDLPKSSTFTDKLPSDAKYPTPASAREAAALGSSHASRFGPRQVKDALYSFVPPTPSCDNPELLAHSPAAFQALGLSIDVAKDPTFTQLLAGNPIPPEVSKVHPWAHCYGGWQFGSWAGQLGDGRALSLFEGTNPHTKERYEVQLKGVGLTPYSRFADGRAVLRSSIREFLASEYLASIGVPSTRALGLVKLPGVEAVRERLEPCAVVARMAPSWVRVGSFDIFRWRVDRARLRILADYVRTEVLKLTDDTLPEGQNRFEQLYRDIVMRNARGVAHWQACGFMNGVLNTDNTSVLGLALDFGPFAFMDGMDASYTPNHDDEGGRYRYDRQPTIIWWNMVRLGEDLAELFATKDCDDEAFIKGGVEEDDANELVKKAEAIIMEVGENYKAEFLREYERLMRAKLGLGEERREHDMDKVFVTCLDAMQSADVDFHQFFRALSESNPEEAVEGLLARGEGTTEAGREAIKTWLGIWRERLGSNTNEAERVVGMKKANPRYVPKGWVLEEIIDRVERKGDRTVLGTAVKVGERCFEDAEGMSWEGITEREKKDVERWCGPVPKEARGGQCSCSS